MQLIAARTYCYIIAHYTHNTIVRRMYVTLHNLQTNNVSLVAKAMGFCQICGKNRKQRYRPIPRHALILIQHKVKNNCKSLQMCEQCYLADVKDLPKVLIYYTLQQLLTALYFCCSLWQQLRKS